MTGPDGGIDLRDEVRPDDPRTIRAIVESTGFFHAHEVDVAVELAVERLARGDGSGYHFVFAQRGGRTVGYACYGPIACTTGSFDLYWVAVDRADQGRGLGRRLVAEVEARVAARGGRRIYVETSTRPQYQPTRDFYHACGYADAAVLDDFYDEGDGKLVLVKPVEPPATGR